MNAYNCQALFVFHLIDDGQSKRTLSDFNLKRLIGSAEKVLFGYLAEHGNGTEEDEELKTDDGYAKIVLTIPGNPDSDTDVWSYSFDGEVSLRYAFQQLNEQIEMLEGSNQDYDIIGSVKEIRERVYVAVGSFCDGTYSGLNASSTLTETNPVVLANQIVRFIVSDCYNGFLDKVTLESSVHKGMTKITKQGALIRFHNNKEVYRLYDDGTEALVETEKDIIDRNFSDYEFGYPHCVTKPNGSEQSEHWCLRCGKVKDDSPSGICDNCFETGLDEKLNKEISNHCR